MRLLQIRLKFLFDSKMSLELWHLMFDSKFFQSSYGLFVFCWDLMGFQIIPVRYLNNKFSYEINKIKFCGDFSFVCSFLLL